MNNKTLAILLIAFGTCCLGGLWMVGRGLEVGKGMQGSAKRWADKELPPAFKTWDWATLKPLLAPEMFKAYSEPDMQKKFGALQKELGPLKDINSFEVEGFSAQSENTVVGLKAVCRFTTRTGELHVKVVHEGNNWYLADIREPGA